MDRIDVVKTNSILSLALVICYLVFNAGWLLWLACLLILGNAFESRITTWIAKCWIQFAHHLGTINSKVILSVIFFLILTPVAFVYRLFNKDTNEHFRANRRNSYFDETNNRYTKKDFEKIW